MALRYIQQVPGGRLEYRRDYPARLRPFIPDQRRGMLRSLGRGTVADAVIRAAYDVAHAAAERELAMASRAATGTFDELDAATIEGILRWHVSAALDDDDASRTFFSAIDVETALRDAERAETDGGQPDADADGSFDARGANLRSHLALLRADYARGKLSTNIAPDALYLAAQWGLRVDPKAPGFLGLCSGLARSRMEVLEALLQRDAGMVVPTPPAPSWAAQDSPAARSGPSPSSPATRTLGALLDAYSADKSAAWAPNTARAYQPVFRLLRDVLGVDRRVSTIDREAGRHLFETLKALPRGMGKVKALHGLSVPDAVDAGRALGLPTIGPKSLNDSYLALIRATFAWAVREQWMTANPVAGLSVHDPVADADKRFPFDLAQLQAIFAPQHWHPDAAAFANRPGRYWTPLIALYSGARRSEICGLAVADVEVREGVPVMLIQPATRRLKTANARRGIPVHPELLRMGFMAFVATRRATGDAALFPDAGGAAAGKIGDAVGDWFARYLGKIGVVGVGAGLHAIRHSVEDRLKEVDLHDTPIGAYIMGRTTGSVAAAYGSGFSTAKLASAVERVAYPGLDLSHLYAAPPPLPTK